MIRPTVARVDLDAIRHNFRAIAAYLGSSDRPAPRIIAVVKANAYGHGAAQVGRALEDAGFSWKVTGSVEGFAANIVASQSPAPGTRVVDTGSPAIQVTLAANGQYKQEGSPENAAPYPGSSVKVAGAETPAATPAG